MKQFEQFQQIIRRLRGENGCPWDREQTFTSLKPCMIDEVTEAIAAIDIYEQTRDADNLCEELGDMLMHIVLLSCMAEEDGLFTMEDVIAGISEKMIRRHPHVFGENASDGLTSEQVLISWEEIKKQEHARQRAGKKEQEKAAFSPAARQVMEHLDKKLKRS